MGYSISIYLQEKQNHDQQQQKQQQQQQLQQEVQQNAAYYREKLEQINKRHEEEVAFYQTMIKEHGEHEQKMQQSEFDNILNSISGDTFQDDIELDDILALNLQKIWTNII